MHRLHFAEDQWHHSPSSSVRHLCRGFSSPLISHVLRGLFPISCWKVATELVAQKGQVSYEPQVQLRQDVFLTGVPSPLKRWLAVEYCRQQSREYIYCPLTRDTTESDLKQRKEILDNGTSIFVDQSVVQAALSGAILILEGLEKAERNVMPIINNLLENREMQLEDGRFLVNHTRFQQLTKESSVEQLTAQKLQPVHPDFLVIAIGIPVPPFPGNPLDPPLRSRFQCLRVDPLQLSLVFRLALAGQPAPPRDKLTALLKFAAELRREVGQAAAGTGLGAKKLAFHHLPALGEFGLLTAARVLALYPDLSLPQLLSRVYPHHYSVRDETALSIVERLLAALPSPTPTSSSTPTSTDPAPRLPKTVRPLASPEELLEIVPLLQSHNAGSDLCIIGGNGQGKTRLLTLFASALGYVPELLFLYRDMTARDLLQRRSTTSSGATRWIPSPLVSPLYFFGFAHLPPLLL